MFSANHAIYQAYGAAVWMVCSLVYYPIAVVHPIDCLVHPGKSLAVFFLMTLVSGEFIGSGIFAVLALTNFFPENRALHILLPLLTAGAMGACYAVLATDAIFVSGGSILPLRNTAIRIVTATLLGLFATPAIIIRSVRLSTKLGFRPPTAMPEDPRWDS